MKLVPKHKMDLVLKMTNGGGELNSFLKVAKDLNFKTIDVEFDLIECDRMMSLIIL